MFRTLNPSRPAGVALAELYRWGSHWSGDGDVRVTGVTLDHREVRRGFLFAALPGRLQHGSAYIAAAHHAGATAILTDEVGYPIAQAAGLPVVVAADPRAALGAISARVYGTELRHPEMLAVTGTNGKTSTVHILDAVIGRLGLRSGFSSTAQRRSGDEIVPSRLTSPEASELHALLARMNEDDVDVAVIEVSAQALTRQRTDGVTFDVAGFTNLSQDHMDDFGDMNAYLRAKQRLFTPHASRRGVVVTDTDAGRRVASEATIPVSTLSSSADTGADWAVQVTGISAAATSFRLTGPHARTIESSVSLIGRHMAVNAALAIVMLIDTGYDIDRVAEAVRSGIDVAVPGRTLLVSGRNAPRLYLDFSHTPDSIAKTVDALRETTQGRLIVILGADGDRDRSKRRPMGQAAADRADLVIITDHHPRFEDPDRIRLDLLEGSRSSRSSCDVLEVPQPPAAVRTALRGATTADTILWVGPGDTDYRVVQGEDLPYSPRRDARRALIEAGWAAEPHG